MDKMTEECDNYLKRNVTKLHVAEYATSAETQQCIAEVGIAESGNNKMAVLMNIGTTSLIHRLYSCIIS